MSTILDLVSSVFVLGLIVSGLVLTMTMLKDIFVAFCASIVTDEWSVGSVIAKSSVGLLITYGISLVAT